MTEVQLLDDAPFVDLGGGMLLHPKGLTGVARVGVAAVARGLGGAEPIEPALAAAGLRPGPVVTLPPSAVALTARALGAPVTAPVPDPVVEVEVAGDESCVLLVEDEIGGLSWVVPDEAPAAQALGARALAPSSVRFTVPMTRVAAPEGARGLLSDLGKKVQAFFFKLTDPVLGPVIHGFAKKWEAKNRPSFVRRLGAEDYRIDDPTFPRLTEEEWRRLGEGPALLFVHGTFSTSAAFRGLDRAVVEELSRRYGGRVFAFNHPSLTADPRENAIAFLGEMPANLSLEVDIVCHSRGGLVSRQIAALGQQAGTLRVRNLVFVGATNAGTALADADHMVDMVSRFTTIAKFIPEGTAKAVVDALVLVVKVLGHGLLSDLEGLAAMNPNGDFMKAMNVPGTAAAEFFAIASDFEPKPGTPLFSLKRVEDLAADRIFGVQANDVVVPRDGVFAENGTGGFPISEARCLKFGPGDGVMHTEFFAEPRTGAQLLAWLESGAVAESVGAVAGGYSAAEVRRLLDAARDRVLLEMAPAGGRALGSRAADFTPEELDKLRPHVINLSEGAFKSSGIYSSTPQDVDSIVREHIGRWAAALPTGEKLRVVVWAHGGLIGERDGLRIAQKHIDWWRKNGIYPIYFVWETGLFDALRSILEQALRKSRALGTRDLWDHTTDPIIELGAHALGGVNIWGAMKHNAELASAAHGGARYVATRLADLAAQPDLRDSRELELHAVGHSAGSIFHSWFLPAARSVQVPAFKTLQLLAPAITVAEFDERLAGEIGAAGAAEKSVLYTMKRDYEEADNCAGVYRKSLLYLIHHALEPKKRTPVLGLEISLRADAAAASLFGLNGTPNAPGRVVWSVTEGDGRSSSRSQSHGGFDDDASTMNSVAANVLNEAKARVAYSGQTRTLARGVDAWPVSDDWLEGIDLSSGQGGGGSGGGGGLEGGMLAALMSAPPRPSAAPPTPTGAAVAPSPGRPARKEGKRRALCVGVDAYPAPNALEGCVNDTRQWHATLTALGFEVEPPLTDKRATRQGILDALTRLVVGSASGDVIVFQYSGHGTQVTDFDGDEDDGTDEALVPVDFEAGAFLVDDDLRAVFNQLPAGVNLTCFIDCCHSGSITRMLGRSISETALPKHTHTRYLKRTGEWPDWMRAHERFRQRDMATRGMPVAGTRTVDANALRWVNFSACNATEVAYEQNGSGDFTRLATGLLHAQGVKFSNRDFQDAVVRAFGESRQQTPQLDCADAQRQTPLLQPLG
jgi:hypothetical protein